MPAASASTPARNRSPEPATRPVPASPPPRSCSRYATSSGLVAPAGSFALAACVGSTHALGGLERTFARLGELIRPNGHVVIGEGYWARPPLGEELDALGAAENELSDLSGLLAAGDSHGLRPVYLATATDEDWRRYEWAYVLNLESYAAANPDEPGIELVRARADAVRSRRLLAARHGEALGFALVAWQRASAGHQVL